MMKRCFLLSTLSLTFLITFTTFTLAQRPSPAGGGWLEFGGEDSFAVARDGSSFSIGKDEEFTIEVWIYPKDTLKGNDEWVIAAKPDSFELLLVGKSSPIIAGQDSKFAIAWRVGPIVKGILDVIRMPDNVLGGWIFDEWHHIAVSTGKKAQLLLYFDGQQIVSIPDSRFPVASGFDLYIGGIEGKGNSLFEGAMDEIRISSKMLKPQVRGRSKADKDTIALWHFDKEEIFKDSSDNGHTLIPKGSLIGGRFVEKASKLAKTWANIKWIDD